jgi:hypothetical protein
LWDEGEIPRIDQEAIDKARDRFQERLKNVPEGVEVKIEVISGPSVRYNPQGGKELSGGCDLHRYANA